MNEETNDRMIMHRDDIRIKNANGQILSDKELVEYLEQKDSILLETELNVGDIIKIKNFDKKIKVLGAAEPPYKYLGMVIDGEYKVVFNQENVESLEDYRIR